MSAVIIILYIDIGRNGQTRIIGVILFIYLIMFK
jgi:hypothetical protein